MQIRCSKPQGAVRQLNVAINLLFSGGDPLAVRTLAGAAHGVLADLVDKQLPDGSWRSKLAESSGLNKGAALKVINHAQNFLKHGDKDPDAELEFDEVENDHIIFFATLECGELSFPLSNAMEVFQVWYLAAHPDQIGSENNLVALSRSLLPGLDSSSREDQLRRGAEMLYRNT
jgi:hypothetical protein